jgi:pimeloyl-ACP methyl ester carboxylesterase
MVENPRKYGKSPYRVAVLHGGPGAAGEMAPVARELSAGQGVLEPLQRASSVMGQVEELKAILEEKADLPATLVGFSWGAWLAIITASAYPRLARKLILIGCGPLEESYALNLLDVRLKRLENAELDEVRLLLSRINDPKVEEKDMLLARLGYWFAKTDTFDPITQDKDKIDINFSIHRQVWGEAAGLRRNGELLKMVKKISCPVVAIHGDYDPHPFQGVKKPLSGILKDFRFILLKNCGHTPWIEKKAVNEFYRVLRAET